MSTFCTSCGTASTGAAFCTSCGAAMGAAVAAPTTSTEEVVQTFAPVSDQTSSEIEGEVEAVENDAASKKKLLLIGAAVVLLVGIGVGSFLAGKSSVDLKKEQKASYDIGFSAGDAAGYDRGYEAGDSAGYGRGDSAGYDRGYDAGDSAGYDRGDSAGYSRGYSSGKTDGCESVFEAANYADHLIEYFPYNSYYRYGRTYVSESDC